VSTQSETLGLDRGMHVCMTHNAYGRFSGEEAVVRFIEQLLLAHGHRVTRFTRSSAEIPGMWLGEPRAFASGIYSWSSKRAMRRLLDRERPDVVHVHNLYPLISPSVLDACREAGVPVVMTVHNYRLTCPNGLHMVRGKVCEECLGGHEMRCVANRCEGTLLKSLGYALRNVVARKAGLFRRNVTMYAALTEFQRRRLIDAGYPAERIAVVPGAVASPGSEENAPLGQYVGFVGRVSPEKNIPALLFAAGKLPAIPFKIAGSVERMPWLRGEAPSNVEWLGHLDCGDLHEFYRQARCIVLPSTCFEGFPTVLAEAMLHGKPVICSRIGGLPEIVEDGVTGLLVEPGDAERLTEKIGFAWDHADRCIQWGGSGRAKAEREYSPSKYYQRLMTVYAAALRFGPGGA
jgi:glycosyltransferase involved in cell wall biosynthesis